MNIRPGLEGLYSRFEDRVTEYRLDEVALSSETFLFHKLPYSCQTDLYDLILKTSVDYRESVLIHIALRKASEEIPLKVTWPSGSSTR